jgi:transposase-like protein
MSAKKYPPENACSVIEEMAARGADIRSIAKALGCTDKVFLRWREENPELEEALKDGRAFEHDKLVGKLLDTAINGTGKEAVTCAIFLLKARHGYRENQEMQQEGPQVNITFELPGSLDPKTYEAHVLKKAIEPAKGKKKAKKDDGTE